MTYSLAEPVECMPTLRSASAPPEMYPVSREQLPASGNLLEAECDSDRLELLSLLYFEF